MATKNHNHIERFQEHFAGRISAIGEIGGDDVTTFKKALYVSFLDTISRAVSEETGNEKRLTDLVRRFGSWDHCEKVSLPHLVAVLNRIDGDHFAEVTRWANGRLASWEEGSLPNLDKDLDFPEILGMWPVDPATKLIAGVTLERLRHIHLLYRYRNALVHEMRSLGYGQEFVDRDEAPYYLSTFDLDKSDEMTWELTYPLLFLEKLCRQALANSVEHLAHNDLNPFERFRFGTYWHDVLNEE